jgi:acetyltransferase
MGVVDVSAGVKYLQEQGIPVYKFPENAAKAFGALYKYSRWLNQQVLADFVFSQDSDRASRIIETCIKAGQLQLGELEGLELLACYGFQVLPTRLAESPEEAAVIADQIGYPVVMKIVSPQILHKSDAGGVMVGLATAEAVKSAHAAITRSAAAYDPDAEIRGVLVQKMAPRGEEVILGMSRYPVFGPLIMFGTGGVFVEVFQDVIFRLAPIQRNSARAMIRGIKGYKLLEGFRGRPKVDLAVLEKLLVGFSDLVCRHPEIQEIDVNPLLVHAQGQGATVADCRILLREKAEG